MSGTKTSEKQTQDKSAPNDDLCAPRHTHRDANAPKDDMSIRNKQSGKESRKQVAKQRKKTRTTAERASEPPPEPHPELATDVPFTAALTTVPAEDWGRTWSADRTIMLRMTSKRVKQLVDKVGPFLSPPPQSRAYICT